MASPKTVLEVAGREVPVSNPQKVYFPRTGHTKLDLVRYYLAVAEGALGGAAGRPMAEPLTPDICVIGADAGGLAVAAAAASFGVPTVLIDTGGMGESVKTSGRASLRAAAGR